MQGKEIIVNEDLVFELGNYWESLSRANFAYAEGEESFDETAFSQMVRETFQVIKKFKEHFLGKELHDTNEVIGIEINITPKDIFDYSGLLVVLGRYSTDINMSEIIEVAKRSNSCW